MKFKGVCVILLLFLFNIVLANRMICNRGVCVKVLGVSGKIVVGTTFNLDTDPDSVKIEFNEIKEKDANGIEVGKSGTTPHIFNSFSSQSFSISDTADVKYQNINATTFNVTANLPTVNATLVTSIYVFKGNGNVTVANETTNIKVGNVKFNIGMMNWRFCGSPGANCSQGQTNEVGKYIDFVLVITGKGSASKTSTGASDGDEYNLGGGAGIILSKKVQYDNKDWTNMAAGYPAMTTTGVKQSFTFRFEKFNSSALYDPVVTVGGTDVGDSGSGTTVGIDVGNSGNGTNVGRNGGSPLSFSTLFTFLAMSLFYILF